MNKKVFIALLLASHAPLVAHDNNFYAGLAVGGGILDAGRSVDQQLISPFVPTNVSFIHKNDQYGTNAEGSLVATWLKRRQNVVFGVNGDVGWGFQKVEAWGTSPLAVSMPTVLENKLDRGFNVSAMGFLGYACGPWTVALKLGYAGATFTETLKEFQGNTVVNDDTRSRFTSGLGFGAFVDRGLGDLTFRLDYTGVVYESFNQNFISDGDTLNIQDVKRPTIHRIMAGVLWKI